MISLLFSLDQATSALSEEEHGLIAKHSTTFELINTRNGRSLFDAVIPSMDKIDLFKYLYAPRNPKVIGVWNQNGFQYVENRDEETGELNTFNQPYIIESDVVGEDGQVYHTEQIMNAGMPMYTFDKQEYLDLLPDIVTVSGFEGNETTTTSRRTTPVEVHKFAGWSDKIF